MYECCEPLRHQTLMAFHCALGIPIEEVLKNRFHVAVLHFIQRPQLLTPATGGALPRRECLE